MSSPTILSPHFDDGVLSCGGLIWHATQQGHAVRVITLFAGPPPAEVPPFAQLQHEKWGNPPDANRLRRAEDIAAYARLGCFDVLHLSPLDAVYRLDSSGQPRYGSESTIFGKIHPDEAEYASELVELVREMLVEESTLYAPLGVGSHVDHQLAYMVGFLLSKEGRDVHFYEELPYIERREALEHAFQNKPDRRPFAVFVSEEAMAAKVAAMAYYRSQIPVLYGDDLSMSRRIRAVASEAAEGVGYAERAWEIEDKKT